MKNYSLVQVGCLRFLDSCRVLSPSLDKLVKSMNKFPIMDSRNLKDELLKRKLADPFEHLNFNN